MMMEMRFGGDAESFRFPAKMGQFPVIGGNGKSDVSLLSGFSNQKETLLSGFSNQKETLLSGFSNQKETLLSGFSNQKETWRPHIFNSPPREEERGGGGEREVKKNETSPVQGASVSWHPHVYSSPPKIFTPHCIVDIIGKDGEDIIGRDGEEPLNLTLREELTGKRKKGTEEDRGRKKMRTTFTGRQIFELEKMFEVKKYLNSSERSDMSRLLNVTEQQVKIWFQNRRTKWKKQENVTNEEAAQLLKNKAGGGEDSAEGKEEGQKKPIFKQNQQNIQKSLQQTSPNIQKSLELNLQNTDQASLQKCFQPPSSSLHKSLHPGASFHPSNPSIASMQQPNNQVDRKSLSMPILDTAVVGKSDLCAESSSSRSHDLGESSGGEEEEEEELLSVGGEDKDSSCLETSELVIDELGEVNKLNVH